MTTDESIIDYLKRRLREVGSTRWEAVAEAAGIAKSLPRKLAYADRENPGVQTVQPLIDFFAAVDRGERRLPGDGNERKTATHKSAP